ncbi:MAG TPA: outer membrane lipoprotein carrier protein LolA [Pyrinomonadaceae bacterium]|nr:outer membrane lipoprotein carrier protein LolA [Pyrinomonadaceae bacterium]
MNNFKRTLVSAFAIVAFLGAISEANAQGTLREVYKRMDAAYKNLSSMRSNVKMEKLQSQLGETDTYEGSVVYVPKKGKDAYIKVEWEKPSKETLLVKNGEYILYKASTNQAITGPVSKATGNSKADSSLAFLNMNSAQLKANYDVALAAEETVASGEKTWHLVLTPKAKSKYKQADLWVNVDGYPIQSKITETNNDTTTVLLSAMKPNVKVDLAEFTLNLPKTVKVVKA